MTAPRISIRNIVLGTLVGLPLCMAAMVIWFIPKSSPCADDRPGLWLELADGAAHLTGRAPAAASFAAVIVAVDWWGYPRSTVCPDNTLLAGAWITVIDAVYRAPLDNLRRGTVLVRPDLVVIAGETSSRAARAALEFAIRNNLAQRGIGNTPLLFNVAVTIDPSLPQRLATLKLRFASNAIAVERDNLPELHRGTRGLSAHDGKITVAGHADSSGRASVNETTAQLRANAIRDALIRMGIESARITAIGYGARLPVASNSTPEGRAANRRVEIRIEPE